MTQKIIVVVKNNNYLPAVRYFQSLGYDWGRHVDQTVRDGNCKGDTIGIYVNVEGCIIRISNENSLNHHIETGYKLVELEEKTEVKYTLKPAFVSPKIGSRWLCPALSKNEYILAEAMPFVFVLINLTTGIRKSDPVQVKDWQNISEQEWEEIVGEYPVKPSP